MKLNVDESLISLSVLCLGNITVNGILITKEYGYFLLITFREWT